MARTALIVKQATLEKRRLVAIANGVKVKNICKHYNRCKLCGRTRSFIRDFGICRVCFRNYARQGQILWLRKAGW